jgi:hypothetical protein
MNEIEKLLSELKSMKSENRSNHIENNKETWSKIAKNDLDGLGFSSIEQIKEWIISNPYGNL